MAKRLYMRLLSARPILAIYTAFVLSLTAPATALAGVAAAAPGGFAAGFATPAVVITEGEGITFANADIAPHNVVADGLFLSKKDAKKSRWCTAFDRKTCPLFWSPTITAGETTEVEGLEFLESGKQYPFLCTLHPGMKGTVIVL